LSLARLSLGTKSTRPAGPSARDCFPPKRGVSAAGEAQLSSAWRRRRTTPIGGCLTSRPAGLGLTTVARTPQRLALLGCWSAGARVTTLDLANRGATWLTLTPDARIACV